MLLGLLVQIWMCCKKHGLMITGMSTRTDICQIGGKDSRNLTLLKEMLPKGKMLSGKRLTKIQATTRPDHVWPEVWTKIGKAAQIEKNKNGQKKKQSSTTLGNREEFTLSIWMTKITKKFSKNARRNWKDLWHQPCRVKDLQMASRKWLRSRRLHRR